jgi:IS1 family transposase/transposase-like protein
MEFSMSSSTVSPLALGCLLWLVCLFWLNRHLWWSWLRRAQTFRPNSAAQLHGPRPLKPRPPSDCADCRSALPTATPPQPTTTPYAQQKSRRGRKKQSETEGHACPHPDCQQFRNTDAATHALVANGHHGKNQPVEDLKCQLCGTKITIRRNTPLFRLKTPPQKVALVLALVAEGLTVAAASFVFGIREATIATWLTRAGLHAQALHAQRLQHLQLNLIQFDELRASLRHLKQEVWLWFALDPHSKLLVVTQLGSRNQAMAHATVHALVPILDPACLPVFLSDGLDLYFYALSAHFEYVTGQATSGIAAASLSTVVPVIFGVLTTETIEQGH